MRLWLFAIVAAAFALTARPSDISGKGAPADKKAEEGAAVSDHKKIQGAWRPISAEKRGKKAQEDEIAGLEFKFDGDKVHVTDKGRNEPEATFTLDPSKNPKEIDVIPNEKIVVQGIYKFDGERLTVRFARGKTPRPNTFDGDIGMDEMRLIFERKPK